MKDMTISTTNLTKTYGKTCAVDGLSLNVPRGAIYGFLGRNGAGKTSTIKMLLGSMRPSGGSAGRDGNGYCERANRDSSADCIRQ